VERKEGQARRSRSKSKRRIIEILGWSKSLLGRRYCKHLVEAHEYRIPHSIEMMALKYTSIPKFTHVYMVVTYINELEGPIYTSRDFHCLEPINSLLKGEVPCAKISRV
jgi:hypothetical protein